MLIQQIKLKNILSFGPGAQDLELKPLNVLVGPNGSGKSNLIEAIGLLQAAPRDLQNRFAKAAESATGYGGASRGRHSPKWKLLCRMATIGCFVTD